MVLETVFIIQATLNISVLMMMMMMMMMFCWACFDVTVVWMYVGMLMQKFDDRLKMSDVTVWLKLQQQDIKPQYYAFRWLTLLLSQEFELPGMVHVLNKLIGWNSD